MIELKPDIVFMWLWFWDFKNILPQLLFVPTRSILINAKIVLFTDDVHSKREQQIAEQFKGNQKYKYYKKRSLKMKLIEIGLYKSVDLVVTITKNDATEIVNIEPELAGKIKHVTFMYSSWDTVGSKPGDVLLLPWRKRSNLVFVGNGENPTNIHAMNWYINDIAPEIEKGIPGVKLFVIGPGWEAFQGARHNIQKNMTQYLKFMGKMGTKEMNNIINSAKVFISPIIASTGINTKNVLALSLGIPLVTTPAGSVGMCEPCDEAIIKNPMDPFGLTKESDPEEMPLLVGRDIYDFTVKVKQLYYEEKVWNEYSKYSQKHVRSWFGKEKATKQLDDIFENLDNIRLHHAYTAKI